ncbi:putative hop2 protein [Rhizophagus irregularis]|uniref:Hop2 n=1 Tax=Rhizophagus irregularis TaxID=588596 RepID=A0A1C9IHL9_9GLOM|nr:Hop2 [Rhizophagus irregularis]AOP04007.1 Hop2 [Rhizophagus irregularis]AOP04008.1 Hop2 [Rhizophagus irregularis]AOP04009.1 Hop2 [Rhizophagus irregularis]AOP04010.1 Hop2 [Rhizophagus irregularis]
MAKIKKVPAAKGDDADVSNNLHGAITKTVAQKVLNALAIKSEVRQKVYGKQSVYVINQEQFESPSQEELNDMDSKIEELKKEVDKYKEKNRQLTSELATLNNSLTNEQCEERLKVLTEQNRKYEERLKELQSGTKQFSVDDAKRIDEKFEKNRKFWRQRKRMFDEIVSTILDAIDMKKKVFEDEELFIERDPIDINEDPLKDL